MPAQTEKEAAPYGRKKDGTPRRAPAPDWVNDPARVAAANAKRTRTAANKRKAAQAAGSESSAPPVWPPAPPANGDLLSGIASQARQALADADREVADAQDAIVAAEAAFHEKLRARDALAAFHEAIT